MVENDAIIINNLLEQKRNQIQPEANDDEFFELFSFEQILKDFELSYDELIKGNTDGKDDGGIDGFFFFINSDIIKEEIIPENYKKRSELQIFIIQSKRSQNFKESTMQKLIASLGELFDLSKDINSLKKFYNEYIIENADIFRKAYISLASKHPILKINCIYTSCGDKPSIHPKILNLSTNLRNILKKLFTDAEIKIEFLGARELLDLSRIEKTYTLNLKFIENTLSKGENNFVLLTNLKDYYDFIIDEKENLRNYIFESNVRDFQGYIEVNKDIQNTLINEKLDFWWLNNGITILASKASIIGKTIILDNIQIINGLQTTHCIYRYFQEKIKNKANLDENDLKRSLLVKILVIKDEYAKDKIIKATNFQTSIPPASLKATDKIHHDLEDYFKSKDLYYDRRKNFYKNQGKPANKIISIPLLAQSINTIINKDPHTSRSRPSSLIKNSTTYSEIFNNDIKPEIYLFSAQLIKKVTNLLKKPQTDFTAYEKSNFRFHISMVSLMIMLNNKNYTLSDINNIDIDLITSEIINKAIKITIENAKDYASSSNLSIDVISKSKNFSDYLKEKINI
jgi:hypothetical protein